MKQSKFCSNLRNYATDNVMTGDDQLDEDPN